MRGLIGWDGDTDAVVDALVWCRRCPTGVRRVFRSRRAGRRSWAASREVLAERIPEAGSPPAVDLVEAAALYQTLYWIARTAAVPTPATDVLHVTAAGWSAVPALVHKALHGTPLVLTEHGVFVREAYLAAIRGGDSPGGRFAATRLARGLARCAYAGADVVSPVTDANACWEEGLGVDPAKILVLYNGLQHPGAPTPPPRNRTVVSVGRIDPLKDVHTMLRVAAGDAEARARRAVPPLRPGDRRRGRLRPLLPGAARAARARRPLPLHGPDDGPQRGGPRRRGRPDDEHLRGTADVDPRGHGPGPARRLDRRRRRARRRQRLRHVTPPGDAHGLAMGVVTLLRQPEFAWRLGRAATSGSSGSSTRRRASTAIGSCCTRSPIRRRRGVMGRGRLAA